MTCQESTKLIHAYLDEDISQSDKEKLLQHIQQCAACREKYHQLEKTILMLKSQSHIQAPEDFTQKVMQQLPAEKTTGKMVRWMKGHPFLVAASLFILLMTGSIIQVWNDGQEQFSVSTPKMEQIVINSEERTVIVPEGVVVEGDLIVRNGDVEVRGEVTGDVIVTEGQVYLASTAHIVGQVEEIDQFMKWTWYHVQRWIKDAIQIKE